jgi:hypothetical protein
MDHIYERYSPMNHSHILRFPNQIPCIYWETYFPKFKDTYGDDASLHLVKFRMDVRKLRVQFHEDNLMKMFIVTWEGKARSWYEVFPLGFLYSPKVFHLLFYEKYNKTYLYISLVKNCCHHFENFIPNLENFYGNEEFMDEKILESLYENHFQHQK